ncbi:MAG: prolyl oligopeptidase family serine peptidase [Atopobiaceae bacterium]|jgi:predicted esterase
MKQIKDLRNTPSIPRRTFMYNLMPFAAGVVLALAGCSQRQESPADTSSNQTIYGSSDSGAEQMLVPQATRKDMSSWTRTEGSSWVRGFRVDDILHAGGHGDIHFSIHVPDSYDGQTSYALYMALPGYEGLLFQGIGANLQEGFPFVANSYVKDMIVVSPQLEDWSDTSADQTIALTRWILSAYNIDPERVVLSGCSGGGETASLAVALDPKLFSAVLHTISRWDGDIQGVVAARLPVYMAIGEKDDYYGPDHDQQTYQDFLDGYAQAGVSDEQSRQLVTLDVKGSSYFGDTGERMGQHAAGGMLFPQDEAIMGWLFSYAR